MKSKFLLLLLFASSIGFSQSVNDYAAVIVPLKYDFIKEENQYRLCTLTKFNLQKAGFVTFYANESLPLEYSDRCSVLNVDVVKENGFLVTKLYVVLKNCNGKEIFKSEVGRSKEKEYEIAYSEALNMAFESVKALNYKYNGKVVGSSSIAAVAVTTVANTSATPQGELLFAQPIKNGFQLIDNNPTVIMKVYKTTNPSIYIAVKGNLQGVAIKKDNQWYFEYYDKETLMSEKIAANF